MASNYYEPSSGKNRFGGVSGDSIASSIASSVGPRLTPSVGSSFVSSVGSSFASTTSGGEDRASFVENFGYDESAMVSSVSGLSASARAPTSRANVNQYFDSFGGRPDTSMQSQFSMSSVGSDRKSQVGGYQAEFVQPLSDKHKCAVCFSALRNPVQTPCGHRFCRGCMEENLRRPNPTCPLDREELSGLFPDNACRREILDLEVKCDFYKKGCSWQGALRDLQKHCTSCDYQLVACQNNGCDELVPKQALRQHMHDECLHRLVDCDTCKERVPLIRMKIHMRDSCMDMTKECPQKCGAFVKRREIENHITKSCPNSTVQCPFHAQGCPFEGHPNDVDSHCTAMKEEHLRMASADLEKGNERLAALRHVADEQQASINQLLVRLGNLEENMGKVEDSDEKRLKNIQEQMDRNLAERLSSEVSGGQAGNIEQRISQIEASITTNEQNVTSLQQQVGKVITQQSQVAEESSRHLAQLDQDDLRLLAMETATYDGCLIWKLVGVDKIMADAKAGRKVSLYSPPFYTGRYGYKACARIYPNGDGTGKGSHLSFFFVIMMGDFDSLLQWPFQHRVSLTLMDQSISRRHLTETFMPDIRSSSFTQPKTGMNVAAGCPRFVSHELLLSRMHSFVKDDTMFLKVRIDTSRIPSI